MKKYLPFILLGVGILVAVGAVVFVSKRNRKSEVVDEEQLIDVATKDKPVASLRPREDGHWLDMKIEKLGKFPATTLDYELLYTLPDGRTQGVPGTVELEGKSSVELELLLGSESSGKFRYDEGVDGGTLSLRFRNDQGKVVARFMSTFVMATGKESVSTPDGILTLTFEEPTDDYVVLMDTFGVPEMPSGEIMIGPYGIFSSGVSGTGSLALSEGEIIMLWDGSEWTNTSEISEPSIFAVGL